MNKRATRKRALVILLTLTMLLGCLGIGGYSKTSEIVNAEELATGTDSATSVTAENGGGDFEYENTYNSENFDVNFKLDSVWDTGYNATITITNTSDSVIENWCLTFPLNETISNIWNASVSETHEDFYVIKNAGWNQDIAVGGSVSFGITVYEAFTEFPEYYTIIGNQADSSDMLLRLYETIYLHDQFDKTDVDNDGLYDIFETAGIRLINGEVIYSDPSLSDTDGDELLDGEEVISEVRKAEHFFYEVTGKDNYYLDIVSYPNLADSDGDGLDDKKDNAPFDWGIYSDEVGDIVVGELTIVSSTYNGIGHAFLSYKSFVDDSLNLRGLSGGYNIYPETKSYEQVDAGILSVGVGEIVTLGNTMKDEGGKLEPVEYRDDNDRVGIIYNRELILEIKDYNEKSKNSSSRPFYDKNRALSRMVTDRQLQRCIQEHKRMDGYGIIDNNCVHVAVDSWNYTFDKIEFYGIKGGLCMPVELKNAIFFKDGWFEYNAIQEMGLY